MRTEFQSQDVYVSGSLESYLMFGLLDLKERKMLTRRAVCVDYIKLTGKITTNYIL